MIKYLRTINPKANNDSIYIFGLILVNLIVFVFLFLAQYWVFIKGNLYGIIDQGFPELSPGFNLYRSFFVWDSTRGLGETQYLFWTSFFEYLYVYLISLVVHSVSATNFIKIYILQVLYYAGVFLTLLSLYRHILKRPYNPKGLLVISLFSSLAVFTIYFSQSSETFLFNQRFVVFMFGLLFFSVNKIINEGKGYVLFALASFVSMVCWAYLGFWVPLFVFLFVYIFIAAKEYSVVFRLYLIHFLINLPAFFALFFFYSGLDKNNNSILQYKDLIYEYANRNSFILNIFSFIGGVNWNQNWGWVTHAAYPIQQLFVSHPWFVIISFFIFGLYVFVLIVTNKQSKTKLLIYFDVSILGSIFLIASYNQPFGSIFTYLLNKVPFFIIFRESHNKVYPLLILLLLMTSFTRFFWLSQRGKKVVFVLISAYIAVSVPVFMISGIYSEDGIFTFPSDKYEVVKEYIPSDSRVLFLPQYSHDHRYDYGYVGNTLTRYIYDYKQFEVSQLQDTSLSEPVVRNLLDNFNIFNYGKSLYNFGSTTPTFSSKALNDAGVEYVVFDKHLVGDTGSAFRYADEYLLKLASVRGIGKVYENDDVAIFQNNTASPVIQGGGVTYQKINPVMYKINIHLDSVEDMSFMETYDPSWSLYLGDYKPINCSSHKQVGEVEVCASSNQLMTGKELGYLLQSPVFDDTHTKQAYYNRWSINPDYIKSTFPRQSYKENADGSIDIQLTMLFKKQVYMYVLLIVSLVAMLATIMMGLMGKFNEKNNENITK